MIISEYTLSRAKKLNIMNFFDMEFPLNLQILWMDILNADSIIAPVLIGSHSHSFYEIHLAFSGKCRYECDGNEYEIGENEALFIPCRVNHKYLGCDADILKTSLAFSCNKTLMPENTEIKKIRLSQNILLNIDHILKYCDNTDIFTPSLVGGRIFEIIYNLIKTVNMSPALPEDKSIDPRFIIAKQFIENNIHLSISVEDVAKECCLSSKQLNRIFKNQTSCSLYDYIVKSKINKAEKLLAGKEKNIKEIGYLLGFENECSSITFFKRHRGITPGKFRANK